MRLTLRRRTNMLTPLGAFVDRGPACAGPWSSDTVSNSYSNRLRTALSLAQPTGAWTNGFGYDSAKRLTNVTSQAGSFAYTLVGQASRLTQKISLPNGSYITNTYDS